MIPIIADNASMDSEVHRDQMIIVAHGKTSYKMQKDTVYAKQKMLQTAELLFQPQVKNPISIQLSLL